MADTDLRLPVHTITTAPEPSRSILEQVASKYGFLPKLTGVFAGAPAALLTPRAPSTARSMLARQESVAWLLARGRTAPGAEAVPVRESGQLDR